MERLIFSTKNPFEEIKKIGKKQFNFLNLYSVYLFRKDKNFRKAVSYKNCVNFPDGTMVAKKLGISKQRGPDFTRQFLFSKESNEKKHFFIGMNEKEIEKLSKITGIAEKKIDSYNPSFISGNEFSEKDKEEMIEKINKFKPDYLWVCVGNPKQEILSHQILDKIKTKKILNVGAALDFILNKQKEAPRFWRNAGLEWFYLGFTNPRRTLKKIKASFIALKYLRSIEKK